VENLVPTKISMNQDSNTTAVNRGAVHSELGGGTETYRFRPQRLATDSLAYKPVCRFAYNGQQITARQVLDVSPTGIAIIPGASCGMIPGTTVDDLQVFHCNNEVWSGRAEVVYGTEDGAARVGLRFTSGQLNMRSLQFRDELVERRLVQSLFHVREFDRVLPAEWRSGISVVRHLLQSAKSVMDDIERNEPPEAWKSNPQRKRELCEMVYNKWWPVYRDQLLTMDHLSALLPKTLVESAQEYAARELMPLLEACPMHKRAYDKPLGYAGDYKLMLLGQDDDLQGESLYGCLLHHTVQNFGLGRAIVQRCHTAARAVSSVVSQNKPTRVVSLASGPAIELMYFLAEHPQLENEVELILVDQDLEALETAHSALSKEILKRDDGHLIKLSCLHFSIGQIISPSGDSERKLIRDVLSGVDLIYSMGLFDYLQRPVALKLMRNVFPMLSPGGRLYVGNLERVSDCSWAMEYSVHWSLIYRTEEDMHDLATRLRLPIESVDISRDASGHCLFMDLRKPAEQER
jgi:extracellular factor (EF) 3-hydroxypalmitic acid methyl ester biosynthesis protein